MDGMTYTKHFQQRSQQRCINGHVIDALLRYGEPNTCRRGIEGLIFTKKALSEIRNEAGPAVFKMCEKVRNAYIIVSSEGVLITVARSYRGTVQ